MVSRTLTPFVQRGQKHLLCEHVGIHLNASASLARAISPLIRCSTLVPAWHSRAVFRMPLPLANAFADRSLFQWVDLPPAYRLAAFGALLSCPSEPSA